MNLLKTWGSYLFPFFPFYFSSNSFLLHFIKVSVHDSLEIRKDLVFHSVSVFLNFYLIISPLWSIFRHFLILRATHSAPTMRLQCHRYSTYLLVCHTCVCDVHSKSSTLLHPLQEPIFTLSGSFTLDKNIHTLDGLRNTAVVPGQVGAAPRRDWEICGGILAC